MDPVKVAYSLAAVGGPAVGGTVGCCARCSDEACLTPLIKVVSPTFTGFDAWHIPSGTGLCPACVWLYRTPALRMVPHLVTQKPSFTALTAGDVFVLLAAGALPATVALSVPLRPNRKHLFPAIRWGTVRTDDLNLTWTAADATRLTTVDRLRRHGFSPRALACQAPPWKILRTLPAAMWPSVQDDWHLLAPWRAATTFWLDLATTITKPRANC